MRRQLRVFSIPPVSDEITCWYVVLFGFPVAFAMAQCTKREKHFLYNSLAILLKAVEKQQTTVDLRNEASITGIVENADAYVNFSRLRSHRHRREVAAFKRSACKSNKFTLRDDRVVSIDR